MDKHVPRRVVYLTAVLLFLVLPLSVGWDFLSGSEYRAAGGSVKAEDFLIFYTAGRLAGDGRAVAAYNYRLMLTAIRAQLGEPLPDPATTPAFATEWPVYLYSPPATLVFAGLARLSFWDALAVWLLATLGALLAAVWLLRRSLPVLQRYPYGVPVMLALGFWPVNVVFTNGQQGAFVLLVYILAFYLTRPHFEGRYDAWAGAVTAVLALLKPQLLVGLLLVWLLGARWRALAGLAIATAAACALSALLLPLATFPAWLGNLVAFGTVAPDAPLPDSDVTVHALLRLALPSGGGAATLFYYGYLAIVLAALVVGVRRLAAARLDAQRRHGWVFVLAALFSVVSPNYLLIHDLTLLLLPLALLFALYDTEGSGVSARLVWLAIFVYWGILVGHFLGMLAHVQLAGLVPLSLAGYVALLLQRDLAAAQGARPA